MSARWLLWMIVGLTACTARDMADDPDEPEPRATVTSRVAQHGAAARARLRPHFLRAGVAYPPAAVTLVAIKDEARVEVWAGEPRRYIRDYPVMAASGVTGPKLREGDYQVPEGLYAIDWLNPNSDYHLSMHVDYPNAFDRAHAADEGRANLGGAIMVHGSDVSIGCLAMGDPAIEELFVLVADAGLPQTILITPTDLRVHPAPALDGAPAWTAELYAQLTAALAPLRITRDGPAAEAPAASPAASSATPAQGRR